MSCPTRRRISERITSSTAHQGRDAGCRQTADEAALFRVFEELRGPVHESAIAHVDLLAAVLRSDFDRGRRVVARSSGAFRILGELSHGAWIQRRPDGIADPIVKR